MEREGDPWAVRHRTSLLPPKGLNYLLAVVYLTGSQLVGHDPKICYWSDLTMGWELWWFERMWFRILLKTMAP